MLEMHHNKGGMQEIYNDGKGWRNTARLQIQKGILKRYISTKVDMSKPGTTKYKTDRISFFISVSMSLYPTHSGAEPLIAEL